MTGQQLKNSILKLAIQGKLVPQDPNDEPAVLLLERIRKEKEKLIKEKKISAEKNSSRIFRGVDGLFYEKTGKKELVLIQDEIPFDIPESWEWVRMKNIAGIEMGQSPDGASVSEHFEGVEFHQGKVYFGEKYLKVSPFKTTMPTKIAEEGDILLCVRAPVGKVNFTERRICVGRGLCAITPHVIAEYLYAFLLWNEPNIVKKATGTTFVAITKDTVCNMLVPIPPVSEQKRIVEKLNEVLPLVDKYGEVEKQISDFNASFPKEMKKSILQYAIQGKLVPQNPEDEPASVLLERIRQEKKKLVKSGAIKKDKHESVIYKRDGSFFEKIDGKERCIDDEIPFDIPESWEWVRLSNLITLISGQDMTPDKYNTKGKGIPYITGASNIENGDVIINRWTEYPKSEASFGDILLTCKGTVGTIAVLNEERVHIARQIMAIRPIAGIEKSYIQVVLMSFVEKLKSIAKSMIPGISRNDVLSSLVSVPPISEQKRIVERFETILPYLSFENKVAAE